MLSLFRKKTETPQSQDAQNQGWFARLKSGLQKSASAITAPLDDLINKRGLDDAALSEIEEILISADMGVTTASEIANQLRARKFDRNISPLAIRQELAAIIAQKLAPFAGTLTIDESIKPYVILVSGVNGAGKTTSIGKIAKQLQGQGKKVMLAAGDTFRAAASEQLQIWSARGGGVLFYENQNTKDAAALAFEALAEARKQSCDVLIIDTAGRLHTKDHLMEELAKILRVLKKSDDSAPHASLLVLDATTGQNAALQAEHFQKSAQLTGLIVTKLDGTARAGVILPIAEKTKLPILAIGIGEGIEDLQQFNPQDFAENLLGL